MPRLTITLSDERYQALKETAARQGKTIRELVEASLDSYGIKTTKAAATLIAEARQRAALDEASALSLAIEETKAQRQQ